MGTEKEGSPNQIPADNQEQIRRAARLLDAAKQTADLDLQFILLVGALHISRSIVEHWLTKACEVVPHQLGLCGQNRDELARRLRNEVTKAFESGRRFGVVSELRNWDFHWEPLVNPLTVPTNTVYGRGAPLTLSTGKTPNSSVTYLGGSHQVLSTGSGRQVGRKNYYRIQQNRFVDFEASQAAPLAVLIGEFLEDLPVCICNVIAIPEISAFLKEERSEDQPVLSSVADDSRDQSSADLKLSREHA